MLFPLSTWSVSFQSLHKRDFFVCKEKLGPSVYFEQADNPNASKENVKIKRFMFF